MPEPCEVCGEPAAFVRYDGRFWVGRCAEHLHPRWRRSAWKPERPAEDPGDRLRSEWAGALAAAAEAVVETWDRSPAGCPPDLASRLAALAAVLRRRPPRGEGPRPLHKPVDGARSKPAAG